MEKKMTMDEFVDIIRRLRGENGCPWDREQTHESLRNCMLEEAYEVMDAIDEGDTDHLYDELGDVLMQVVMHAEIARKHGEFDISDVTTAICEKLISRHTHIFGGDTAFDAAVAELSAATTDEAKNAALTKLQALEQELVYKAPVFTVGNAVYLSTSLNIPQGVSFCNPLYACDVDYVNWTIG